MFDMRSLVKRYYDFTMLNGRVLHVEPPKMKVLKKIMKLAKLDTNNIDEDSLEPLTEGLALALSKNKENVKITEEYIDDNFNINEIQDLLTDYFDWVDSIQSQKN